MTLCGQRYVMDGTWTPLSAGKVETAEGVSQVLITRSIARSFGSSSHIASIPVTHPRHAFPADLLRAAPFTDGMDQLDAAGVDHPEHGRGGQESPRPVLRGREGFCQLVDHPA